MPNSAIGLCVAALLSLLGTTASRPLDSWLPFKDQRVISASGRYYAVLRGDHGAQPLRFEFVRRREGVPPIEAAASDGWLEAVAKTPKDKARAAAELAKVARDPADELLASGTMPQVPLDFELLELDDADAPLGLLLFDRHGSVGRAQILSYCDARGRVAWSHDLVALFGGVPAGSSFSVSSTWWNSAWGYDRETGKAWLLANSHELRLVDIATGEITTPTEDVVAGLASRVDSEHCDKILHALLNTEGVQHRALAEPMEKLAQATRLPQRTRLKAAVLATRGGCAIKYVEAMFRFAAREAAIEDARFAGLYLAEICGDSDAALPDLIALLCRDRIDAQTRNWSGIRYEQEFEKAGERGINALRRLSENPDVPGRAVLNASILLWRSGHADFSKRLGELLQRERLANTILNTMIACDPEGMHEFLVQVAQRGATGDPVRLAMYFRKHPDRRVTASLQSALDSMKDGDASGKNHFERTRLRLAIDACRDA